MRDLRVGEESLLEDLGSTVAQVGTALGLAALVPLSAARTDSLIADGLPPVVALVEGFRTAFFSASGLAVAGALVILFLLRTEGATGSAVDPCNGPRRGAEVRDI